MFLLVGSYFSSPPHSGQKPANSNSISFSLIKGFQGTSTLSYPSIVRYHVSVKFSSDRRIEVCDGEILIFTKSSPEHSKANRELVKKLAGYFDVTEDRIKIISGLKSRKKIIEVV